MGNTSRLEKSYMSLERSNSPGGAGDTLLFPPRFRFTDSKEERLNRVNMWNSYLDVTPNVDPLKAVFSRHCDNHLKQDSKSTKL